MKSYSVASEDQQQRQDVIFQTSSKNRQNERKGKEKASIQPQDGPMTEKERGRVRRRNPKEKEGLGGWFEGVLERRWSLSL